MKKGSIIRGKIEETRFPNVGIIFNEKPIEVKGVIKGQEVEVRITKNREKTAKAELQNIIKDSYIEKEQSKCKNFGNCGGCFYQKVSYEDELNIKREHVAKLLLKYSIDIEEIIPSPENLEYRNKMELSFGDEYKDGPTVLGLHKKKSKYDILDIDDCVLMTDDFRIIREKTINYFREKGIPYYHKVTHKGYLRYLLLRRSEKNKEILVNIVTSSQLDFEFNEYIDLLKNLDTDSKIVGILHTVTDTLADAIKDYSVNILYGRDYITENLFDLEFNISPFSFFQTNTLGAEKLYSKVIDFIGDINNKVIFDLYSGTGTIAQVLAKSAKKVIGIEIIEEAVEAAKLNAKINGINNCKFIAGDVLKEIDNIDEIPDCIVLDPPREGIHPKAIGKIIEYGANEIVYVSCKPTSLVNDLDEFIKGGYKIKRVACVDMFPMTTHVESVVLMSKVAPHE